MEDACSPITFSFEEETREEVDGVMKALEVDWWSEIAMKASDLAATRFVDRFIMVVIFYRPINNQSDKTIFAELIIWIETRRATLGRS
mmetsp:Transcript_51517/g.109559  ORF Transcript_51517/g.109559 Transcript_51517/m.109559 type:complete len:88 (+) Transcript_51517:658-921(+)